MITKPVNLTADEIIALIMLHGREMDEDNMSETIERINYLNKRLKEFNKTANTTPIGNPAPEPFTGNPDKDAAQGWV